MRPRKKVIPSAWTRRNRDEYLLTTLRAKMASACLRSSRIYRTTEGHTVSIARSWHEFRQSEHVSIVVFLLQLAAPIVWADSWKGIAE